MQVKQGTGNREQGTVGVARLAGAFALVLACVLAGGAAEARRSDREQPLSVNAADMDGVMKDDGQVKLRGNVQIDQGTLAIRAANATLVLEDGAIQRVVLEGAPATMAQQGEDGALTRASAQRIEYDVPGETLLLLGQAVVDQPRGTLHGERLSYHLGSERVEGGGEGGRVHMVIQPKTAPEPGADDGDE